MKFFKCREVCSNMSQVVLIQCTCNRWRIYANQPKGSSKSGEAILIYNVWEIFSGNRAQTQCILDQPIERRYYDRMFEDPAPGAMFSANQQCQFVFGQSAELCPYMVGRKTFCCKTNVSSSVRKFEDSLVLFSWWWMVPVALLQVKWPNLPETDWKEGGVKHRLLRLTTEVSKEVDSLLSLFCDIKGDPRRFFFSGYHFLLVKNSFEKTLRSILPVKWSWNRLVRSLLRSKSWNRK